MLEEIYVLKIKVEVLTGLYIGGNDNGFDIGGADSNVIKNPLTKEPYIPGSSLKGKIKSLLKYNEKTIWNEKDKKLEFEDPDIANIFETCEDKKIKHTRAIFRDLLLTEESKKELNEKIGFGVFTEIKAENKINPLSGTSDSPRFIERVVAGSKFEGEIILNVFEGDDREKMEKTIYKALKLLEYNYLGGNGTRGYGKVKVYHKQFEKVDI